MSIVRRFSEQSNIVNKLLQAIKRFYKNTQIRRRTKSIKTND
jgi:hypothetical protein